METALGIGIGIGLSAACGFRVFVPLLVMSVAARTGHLELAGGFEWIESTPAMISFAVATALEVGAYYVPWLDNLLDGVAAPAAVIAGTITTASVVTGIDPWMKWTLAVIAGGGIAGAIHAATAGVRGLSLVSTGGLTNPVVSSAEAAGSAGLSVTAIVLPFVAVAAVVGLLILAAVGFARRLFAFS